MYISRLSFYPKVLFDFQLSKICSELDRLWDENKGNVIVYMWSQYIKEETASLLSFGTSLKIEDMKPKRSQFMKNIGENAGNQSAPTAGEISCDTCQSYMSSCKCGTGSDLCDNNSVNSNKSLTNCSYNENGGLNATGGKSDNECLNGEKQLYRTLSSDCDGRTMQDIAPKTNLFLLLRNFDQEMHKKLFEKKVFSCDVCFCEKIGSQCLEFWPCDHVYCKGCMKNYFEVQIKDGNVKFLKCPSTKCTSEANPKQVSN